MASLRRLAWLPLAATVACSGNRGPALRIILGPAAADDGRCYEPGQPPRDGDHITGTLVGGDRITSIRVTIRTYAPGDTMGNFLCDRVLQVPRDAPSIRIPAKNVDRVDIYAEAYAPAPPGETLPHRVAVGALTRMPVGLDKVPDLRLYPDERFRCHNASLNRPRAFHTATLLPNGQVLIVGGLVTGSDPNNDAFTSAPLQITSDVEVYDPGTASFIHVAEQSATPLPRAFHQAVLVGRDPPYQIMLVGGATPVMMDGSPAPESTPAFGLNTGVPPGTRIVPFDTSGVPTPLTVAAAPTELLVYDPDAHTSTRMTGDTTIDNRVFQAGAAFADGFVAAGGIDWHGNPLTSTVNVTTFDVTRTDGPRKAPLVAPRMGATLTVLTDDTALLWGGQIDLTAMPTPPPGELLSGLGAMNTPKSTGVTLATAQPTQFHTATLLPPDPTTANRSILVSGGFVETTTSGGQAVQPPPPNAAVRILTVTPTGTVTSAGPVLSGYGYDATCASDTRLKPAGWQSTLDLGRGRVLLTGGAPTITAMCNDCDGGSDYRCGIKQASIFTAPSTIAPTNNDPTEKMQVPRYGHTTTLMPDGNVLVIGGIGAPMGTPRLIGDVEVYDPRPVIPLYDAASGNPDPDDPIAAEGLVREPGQPLADPRYKPCDQL